MLNGYLFVFLLGNCILSASGQETKNCSASAEDDLLPCLVKNPSLLTAIMGVGDDDVVKVLCSASDREVLSCVLDVYQRCPEFRTEEDPIAAVMNSTLPINVTQIVNADNTDLFCDLMTGGPCADMVKCFEMVPSNGSDTASLPKVTQRMADAAAFDQAKQYLFFQQQTSMTCGPLKPMMECLLTGMQQCPAMKELISTQITSMIEQEMQGALDVKVMTFDEMSYLVLTQCPILPEGFSSDTCLPTQLMSSNFTTCHKTVADTYNTMAKMQNCDAYDALEGCFIDNVEPACGAPMSSFMTRNTPLMIDGISNVCVTGGSSKPLATSIIIMMAALFGTMATIL